MAIITTRTATILAEGADTSVSPSLTIKSLDAAPTLSNSTISNVTETAFDHAIDVDTADGVLYRVVTTSATPPSVAQIMAGTDGTDAPVPSASAAIASIGTKTASFTGLTTGVEYFVHAVQDFGGFVRSAISTSAGATPQAPAASDLATVLGTWSGTVSSGGGGGDIGAAIPDGNYSVPIFVDHSAGSNRDVNAATLGGQALAYSRDTYLPGSPGIALWEGAVASAASQSISITPNLNLTEVAAVVLQLVAGASTLDVTTAADGTGSATITATVLAGDQLFVPAITNGATASPTLSMTGATLVFDQVISTGERAVVFRMPPEAADATGKTWTITCSEGTAGVRLEPLIVRPAA